MHPTRSVSIPPPAPTARTGSTRFLYSAFALLLLALTFLGFQFFYLHGQAYPGRPLMPETKTLVVFHGLLMSAWILLFVAQPLLIATGRKRLHMALGKIGAAVAAGVVVVSPLTSIAVVRHGPEFSLWGLNRRQFTAIPLLSIVLFAVFVALGVWFRRRAEIHRPMMLLATFAVLAAATDRIGPLVGLYADTFWGHVFGPFFPTLVLGAAFLGIKGVLTRSVDRSYALGFAALAIAFALIMRIATTDPWHRFASFLVG